MNLSIYMRELIHSIDNLYGNQFFNASLLFKSVENGAELSKFCLFLCMSARLHLGEQSEKVVWKMVLNLIWFDFQRNVT